MGWKREGAMVHEDKHDRFHGGYVRISVARWGMVARSFDVCGVVCLVGGSGLDRVGCVGSGAESDLGYGWCECSG